VTCVDFPIPGRISAGGVSARSRSGPTVRGREKLPPARSEPSEFTVTTSSVPDYLSIDDVRRALEIRDLTDPAQGAHGIQILLKDVISALTAVWVNTCRCAAGQPFGVDHR
jgi:hypothetical protein